MKKNKNHKLFEFFIDCFINLQKHNVKLIFIKNKQIYIPNENVNVLGYWDDANPKQLYLACTVYGNKLKWLEVFVHEYCHFLQYLDKDKIWKKNNTVLVEDMEKILHNKYINPKKAEKCLNATRDLELDCEKRAVKLIKKYHLPINIKKYIKQANAYIHFYNHIKVYRQWYKINEQPYVNREIVKLCSPNFYQNYETIPQKLQEKFNHFYPPKKHYSKLRRKSKYAKR